MSEKNEQPRLWCDSDVVVQVQQTATLVAKCSSEDCDAQLHTQQSEPIDLWMKGRAVKMDCPKCGAALKTRKPLIQRTSAAPPSMATRKLITKVNGS